MKKYSPEEVEAMLAEIRNEKKPLMTFRQFSTSNVIMRLEWNFFDNEWKKHNPDAKMEVGEAVAEMVKACFWAEHLQSIYDDLGDCCLAYWNIEQFEAHWLDFEMFWDGLVEGQPNPSAPSSIVRKDLDYREQAVTSFMLDALIDVQDK
jgi:hypothetical protein